MNNSQVNRNHVTCVVQKSSSGKIEFEDHADLFIFFFGIKEIVRVYSGLAARNQKVNQQFHLKKFEEKIFALLFPILGQCAHCSPAYWANSATRTFFYFLE